MKYSLFKYGTGILYKLIRILKKIFLNIKDSLGFIESGEDIIFKLIKDTIQFNNVTDSISFMEIKDTLTFNNSEE